MLFDYYLVTTLPGSMIIPCNQTTLLSLCLLFLRYWLLAKQAPRHISSTPTRREARIVYFKLAKGKWGPQIRDLLEKIWREKVQPLDYWNIGISCFCFEKVAFSYYSADQLRVCSHLDLHAEMTIYDQLFLICAPTRFQFSQRCHL